MNRRTILKGAGSVGATAAAGGLGLIAFSGGASADVGHLSIAGDYITTDDGTVEDVRVAVPEAYVIYDGIDEDVTKVRLTLEARSSDGSKWERVTRRDIDVSMQSSLGTSAGSITVSLGEHSLVKTTSWKKNQFRSKTDGDSKVTTVTYRLRLQLFASGTEVGPSAQYSADVDYIVKNEKAESKTGGHGSGTLDGEDQDP